MEGERLKHRPSLARARMRTLRPIALLLLLAPLAAATPATPPWQFEGSRVEGTGAVGEAIEVAVRVRANVDSSARIVLRAPEWVTVEGDAWDMTATEGQLVERGWRLTPTREGAWAAIAHSDPADFGAACACAVGLASGAPEARVAATTDAAMPVALLERDVTTRPLDDGTVEITRSVTPVSTRLGVGEIRVWITQGETRLCASCDVAAPRPEHETRGAGSAMVSATAALPLREGDAYTLWDAVSVRYEAPEGATLQPESSETTGCENRRWGTDESWGCADDGRRGIPAPGALAATTATTIAAALAAQRPPRGKRR